ncbi:MAG: S41 family peptidase [Marinilabiliaceae bacterium]|nr:S41 family peptidase [Marinilabiliaceae bacterium]
MKFKYLTTLILWIIAIAFGFSQSRFSKHQLESDLDNLYSVIYDIHPDMFAVMSKENFEKEFDKIKSNLKDSLTDFDFFVKVAPLIHDLEDGHTALRPPYYLLPPLETDIFLETFPFKLLMNPQDTSLIVMKDFSGIEPIIPDGSRITQINNYSDKEVISKLLKYVSGEKIAFRMIMFNNYFSIVPSVILPVICETSVFTINYNINCIEHLKTVKSIPANDIKEHFIPQEQSDMLGNQPNYRFEINKEHHTAIVRFDSFDLNNYLYTFLDSTFNVINEMNINNLIIDLRYNGGGNSRVGDEFFQYISKVPFEQYGKTYVKVSDVLKEWEPEEYGDKETSSIIIFEVDELTPLRENPLRYNGNTYLLTSTDTFSSATDFAWAFQYFKMGTIIGEETGGLIVCFGDMMGFNLDNTNLHFGVSFKKFYGYGATDENTHGVIPDINLPAEKAMEKAFELIKNNTL